MWSDSLQPRWDQLRALVLKKTKQKKGFIERLNVGSRRKFVDLAVKWLFVSRLYLIVTTHLCFASSVNPFSIIQIPPFLPINRISQSVLPPTALAASAVKKVVCFITPISIFIWSSLHIFALHHQLIYSPNSSLPSYQSIQSISVLPPTALAASASCKQVICFKVKERETLIDVWNLSKAGDYHAVSNLAFSRSCKQVELYTAPNVLKTFDWRLIISLSASNQQALSVVKFGLTTCLTWGN